MGFYFPISDERSIPHPASLNNLYNPPIIPSATNDAIPYPPGIDIDHPLSRAQDHPKLWMPAESQIAYENVSTFNSGPKCLGERENNQSRQ